MNCISGRLLGLSGSELLFYGGLTVMAAAAAAMLVCALIFVFTGRRLRKKLEQEYGEVQRRHT